MPTNPNKPYNPYDRGLPAPNTNSLEWEPRGASVPVQANPTPPTASKPSAGLGTPMSREPTICPR